MTRTLFPEGSYCDALPSGAFVVQFTRSHFETHLGRVELPPGEPAGLLFIRCSEVGGFHFAGKALNSNLMWEWDGAWRSFDSQPGRGCYGLEGVYQDALPAGLQYCADDGTLVSRLVTYPPVDGLSEWTVREGVRIGQGHDGGGVRVFANNKLRELEPGFCIFVNFNRDGERAAVAFWKVGVGAVIVQTTFAELAALPIVGATVPNPGTPPVPVPVPVPNPEPVPMPPVNDTHWRDELEVVKDVDRDYPGEIRTNPHGFLDQLAHRLNRKHQTDRFGRKRKGDGSLNDDVITYRLSEPWDKKLIDVIGGDARFPMWDVRPASEEPGNGTWSAVESPDRDLVSSPPPPPPPPVDLKPIFVELDRLAAMLREHGIEIARLRAVIDTPAPKIDLSPYAKYGDPVEVSGRVSIFGLNKWGGTIVKKV